MNGICTAFATQFSWKSQHKHLLTHFGYYILIMGFFSLLQYGLKCKSSVCFISVRLVELSLFRVDTRVYNQIMLVLNNYYDINASDNGLFFSHHKCTIRYFYITYNKISKTSRNECLHVLFS